jgi:hypothetical protein
MKRRITFLLTVFIVLLAAIVLIGWISKTFIFGKLEPPFLGALVAAGGTIFAACIAYSAAIENLRIAQKAVETAEKRQADAEAVTRSERRTRNVHELDQMQHLKDFLERLLTQFAGASDRIGDSDYYSCYKNADRLGLLIPFLGPAPDNFGVRGMDLMQRLIGVQGPIAQAEGDLRKIGAGAAFNIERERFSAAIRTIIDESTTFLEMVDVELRKRQDLLGHVG